MGLKNKFGYLGVFFLGVLLSCCGQAIANFPYRYYNLQAENFSGILEGDRPENNLSLEECKPSPGNLNPCTVLLSPEFRRLKTDRQKLEVDLKTCLDNQNSTN